MTRYNEAQIEFREKSKGRIQRQLEISESHTWSKHTQYALKVTYDTLKYISINTNKTVVQSCDN